MTNVDMGFVKFVKKKKHIKNKENSEEEDYYDDILLGRKHENEPFNNIKPNKIKKVKEENRSLLYDYLMKNKGKIVEEKVIKSQNKKNKNTDDKKNLNKDEDYDSENSDDYDEEKLNHYIRKKDEDENEIKETLNEIKRKIKR